MCSGCAEVPMQVVPQAPGGRRELRGRRGGRTVTNRSQAPANTNNHRLNRSNTDQRWAPSWVLLRPSRPVPRPPPRFARKQRGPAPRPAAAPAGSRKKGMQRTSSPLRMARNFSLFFLSRCFLFSSPAEPDECFALQTADRWGGEDNIQDLKKFANASRISLKTALKYSVDF